MLESLSCNFATINWEIFVMKLLCRKYISCYKFLQDDCPKMFGYFNYSLYKIFCVINF